MTSASSSQSHPQSSSESLASSASAVPNTEFWAKLKKKEFELIQELATQDPVLEALCEEMRVGKLSAALDELWKQRNARYNQATGQNQIRIKGYYDFYKKILSNVDVFPPGKPQLFIDLGVAPGGMSKLRVEDFKGKGVAFSLDETKGGFQMQFQHKNLKFIPCDMTNDQEFDTISTAINGLGEWLRSSKVTFMNLEIVMSKPQRQNEETRNTRHLNITICRNLFVLMLRYLEEGGSVLWIFKSTLIPTWFYFLDKLIHFFPDEVRLFWKQEQRAPVYALCRGFKPNGTPSAAEWLDELEEPGEIDREMYMKWRMESVEELRNVIDRIGGELHTWWDTRTKALGKCREQAEREYGQVPQPFQGSSTKFNNR